jgi:putative tryptophan/tyrosine transport system substrate-binding protein
MWVPREAEPVGVDRRCGRRNEGAAADGPPASSQYRIAELALNHRLPTLAPFRGFAEAGCLMAYGPNLSELFRRAATFVDQILQGAKPANLPVEPPTRFELVINRKTAKALGLALPPSLLARADEVLS